MATTDQLIQEQPKLVAGIVKASLKALRFIHKQREATIATAMKFAGLDKNLATQMYAIQRAYDFRFAREADR
jgi:ABC-type nitrate/sulfonate/bicarbonate transport system substrate-binding protein